MFCILVDRALPPTLGALLRTTLTPRLALARAERRSLTRQRYLDAGYGVAEADQRTALVVDRERDELVVKRLKAKGPWAVCVSTVADDLTNAEPPGLEFIEATAVALANESERAVWLFLDRPDDLRAASLDARGQRRWTAPEGEEPQYSKEPLKRVAAELKVSLRALAALRLEAARPLLVPEGMRVQQRPRVWTVLDANPVE